MQIETAAKFLQFSMKQYFRLLLLWSEQLSEIADAETQFIHVEFSVIT